MHRSFFLVLRTCDRSSNAHAFGSRHVDSFVPRASQKSFFHLMLRITLAIEYVDRELLTNRFHVTHYGGCAVLFNKDTFLPGINVKSIYLHDIRHDLPDKVFEGESGWVIQGIISRASFRRHRLSGQKSFTVMSLHINNNCAKKRTNGKKRVLTIRAVMLEDPCFVARCLTHFFHTFLHTFSDFCAWLVYFSLTGISSISPSIATLQGGSRFGRLAEQSPLSFCEPKCLIWVTCEHSPIHLPSRKGSHDTNLDDLATTVDAPEICDITDVGRLTSPLFSQEREGSTVPSGVSCSQTHSNLEKSRRDAEFKLRETVVERYKESTFRVCAGFPKGKGKDSDDFFEKKADHVIQAECAAQTRLSEAQAEFDQREWTGEVLILLLMKLTDSLNPREWNSIRQVN